MTTVKHHQPADVASNSFSRKQLLALRELCRKARTVPELRVLMRSEAMADVDRKAGKMLDSIAARSNGAAK